MRLELELARVEVQSKEAEAAASRAEARALCRAYELRRGSHDSPREAAAPMEPPQADGDVLHSACPDSDTRENGEAAGQLDAQTRPTTSMLLSMTSDATDVSTESAAASLDVTVSAPLSISTVTRTAERELPPTEQRNFQGA